MRVIILGLVAIGGACGKGTPTWACNVVGTLIEVHDRDGVCDVTGFAIQCAETREEAVAKALEMGCGACSVNSGCVCETAFCYSEEEVQEGGWAGIGCDACEGNCDKNNVGIDTSYIENSKQTCESWCAQICSWGDEDNEEFLNCGCIGKTICGVEESCWKAAESYCSCCNGVTEASTKACADPCAFSTYVETCAETEECANLSCSELIFWDPSIDLYKVCEELQKSGGCG